VLKHGGKIVNSNELSEKRKTCGMKIIPFTRDHWNEVAEIYRLGLETGNASFETEVPDYETWIKKFREGMIWVAISRNYVTGWVGLLPVSVRKVYEGVVEISIYIHPDHTGKGIAGKLMDHAIHESEKSRIWTIYSSIFQENAVSIHLHENHGFRKIGYREKIAKRNGIWRNTVIYERRSKKFQD
jgi:L-amino acid N-acyltransferase YncA